MSESQKHGAPASGLIALVASVLLCAAAHILLRSGAVELSPDLLANWRIAAGLAVYGSGTLLWLYCLSKLELSVAFPASALQFILVLAGARWILGEHMSALQLVGTAIILLGIALLFVERRHRHA